MKPFPMARLRGPALALAIAMLSGCASFRDDGGIAAVRDATRPHLPNLKTAPTWARSDDERRVLQQRVNDLLAQPLDADGAVQIALLNNRGLQAAYAELGLAEADLVQAGRLLNPGLTVSHARRGDEVERGLGVQLGIAHLIAMPWAGPLEQRRFEQVQQQTALRVLSLAHATRHAYVHAVAADASLQHLARAHDLAQAGADLAQRMAAAGNWAPWQQAAEQGLWLDTSVRLAEARQTQVSAREQLLRLLGVADPSTVRLPDRLPTLPELPAATVDLPKAEQQAMASRLDLQRLRVEAEANARSLGLVQGTRFINVLELGLSRTRSSVDDTEREVSVSFELPLFDAGGARNARAQAAYAQTLDRAAEAAVNARSEVREAHRAYRARYDIARRYQDELVPLRKRLADENLRRYNAMLIGVFDLLADARAQVDTVDGALQATRDFWLAQADLDMAMAGPLRPAAE